MSGHPLEALSAYADGELPPEEARRLESHLERCTECARELALIRTMGGAMRTLQPRRGRASVWEGVHRRITRPLGWVLLVVGVALWTALALVSWFRQALTPEWLAATAVGVGLAMLAIGIAYEQYREWRDSPYKDVER
jgi:anti-sigma factor RsiW